MSYTVDAKLQDIKFYWCDDSGAVFNSILNLKIWLESKHKKLVFAMNGGMFQQDYSPQGLYIQEQKILSPLNTLSGKGNFYIKPNGVFYITMDNRTFICKTSDFKNNGY